MTAEFTRWADSLMPPLVRGQRITITHGGVTTEYRVTDIYRDELNGHETYTLQLADEVSNADPSDETRISDAMAEAQDHPGRVVTR